ncbi:MAG: SDR family NAD(P)-dependent oxidoreductase [Bdellovibrionota bacterium]
MIKIFNSQKRDKHRKSTYKPVILVTGCGSGIGLAIAKLLYTRREFKVCITARDKSIPVLESLFKQDERFKILSLDVTLEADRARVIGEIKTVWSGVDILINNAGISYRAVVEHMAEKDEYAQMATNYFGPMGMIRLVLPYMRQRGRGKIINVSSVSGMLAMPTMASYSASKHALEGASEALWYEARPFGIDVSLIQPGFVHSNSFTNVYRTELSRVAEGDGSPYSDFYKNMTPFVEKLMNYSPTGPDDIAVDVLLIIKKQNPMLWNSVTWDAVLFYYLRRFLPRRMLLPFLFWFLPNAKNWAINHTHRRE